VEGNFLKDCIAIKEAKTPMFQVLLLDKDASDYVEVQEAQQVDFFQVRKHLKNGGSVFITSKASEKQLYPKPKRS
jgi:hypothetical protein